MENNKNEFFNPSDDNYFTYKGRLARKPFIIRTIVFYVVIALVYMMIVKCNFDKVIFSYIFIMPMIYAIFANANRRFHDIGKSSKWTWVFFFSGSIIPILQIVMYIYLFAKKGQVGPNQYGDDPLAK